MSRCIPYTPPSKGSAAGVSAVELLVAVAITATAVAATAGLFQVSHRFMQNEKLEIEATQAARAALDVMVRDLRLSGACLPITGNFVSLRGVDNADEDQITTRTGLTRPDLSCVRSATATTTPAAGSTIALESVDGFRTGTRGYIRGADGSGEFFDVTSVDAGSNVIGRNRSFAVDYPVGSGVYAVDERRYYISHWNAPWGDTPELMLQVGNQEPQSFAVGIEELRIEYQLRKDCPACAVVTLPADDAEWQLVEQVFLTVTARSDKKNQHGQYYRRTLNAGVKPRNLLPQ